MFMKFRLASLVVISAAIAFAAASHGRLDWAKMGWLVLGGFLVTGSSNGFNQILERDLDKLMNRTQNRPLPQERMSVAEALILASITGIAGIVILWYFMNPLSGLLGLLALILYTVVYTPLKRITPFAVFVGAFPGAIPPLLGCVAATEGFGTVPLIGWVLFAGQFIWQFPHFWAIAWVLDDDYKRAGFKMLPSPGGRDKSSAFQVLVYTLFLYPISLMPVMFHFSGMISSLIISFCSIYFLYQAYILYKDCTVEAARKLMFGSFFYLPAIQLAV
ncbi:MAG: protoheme IX farnesyltransferase, partial [Bacteroidetes bacterium]|nr:protoheme IX farnesyltransferase [Bacteroidota bacterium]